MAGNTIRFSVHANPLKDEEGRTTYQVRQDTRGTLDTQGLTAHLRRHHMLANIFTAFAADKQLNGNMVDEKVILQVLLQAYRPCQGG